MNVLKSAAAAIAAVAVIGACSAPTGNRLSQPTLAANATSVLEADPNVFVLEATDGVARVLCDTDPLGTEPANPTSISHVTIIYVWAYCAEKLGDGQRGGDMIFPAVVHLDGSGRVDIPGDDAAFAADVKRLFPARLLGETNQAPDPDKLVRAVYAKAGWPPPAS